MGGPSSTLVGATAKGGLLADVVAQNRPRPVCCTPFYVIATPQTLLVSSFPSSSHPVQLPYVILVSIILATYAQSYWREDFNYTAYLS
jgi:hypothetical protein